MPSSSESGQSIIEVLIASFVLGLLAIALSGVAILGTKTALVSEQRTVAQAIANKQAEIIKLTPYADVGYNDGSMPDGIFTPSTTINQNNQNYVVSLDISLIDDPENGCLDPGDTCDGSTITEANTDYKEVVVSVKYPAADTVTKEVKVSSLSVAGQAAALLNLVECNPSDVTGSCPAGELCCGQQCVPQCEPGSCPDGYTCADDGCGCELDTCSWCDTAACFNDFECMATNQQCLEGSCQDYCVDSADCPAGENCLFGLCERPCDVNSECAPDKTCQANYCRPPICLDDTYCQTGYKCVNFQCVPEPCTVDNECPVSYQCLESTCMPNPCHQGQCPGDWQCVAGQCQPPQCNANQPCNGTACVQNSCQPASCGNHEQCQGEAVCLGGVCSDPPPCPCPGTLQCVAGVCVNPSRDIVPLAVSNTCPAPVTSPCLPAVGEITVTWAPVEGANYCTPIITTAACTTATDPTVSWSDTDGDGITNCGPPGTSPAINACPPYYPIECGTSCPGCPSCPAAETCLEGRCFPQQPCPAGYTAHPAVAGACVKEWALVPPVICPASCPGSSYCSGGQCVTAGCQTDEQCQTYGDYMCRNAICVPKKERDCSYCVPPERTQYCYGLDCQTCSGGAGTICTDPVGVSSTTAWQQDPATGCASLTCPYAPSLCGNGVVQPGEDCDPPGSTSCPGGINCSASCSCPAPVCGNNIVEGLEDCDGTAAACPSLCGTAGAGACRCPSSSPAPACGNGIIETGAGEDCDPGASPTGCAADEYCASDCWCYSSGGSGAPPPPTCGNGTIDAGEMCDYAALPDGCAVGDICEIDCICYASTPTP